MSEGPIGRAEAQLAALEKIIADFRAGVRELAGDERKIAPVRQVAINAIKRLGYTENEARRYLEKGWRT